MRIPELRNTFICPAANECEEIKKNGCIFDRSCKSWKTKIPVYEFWNQRTQLEEIYFSNCRKLIKVKDRKARQILALEIFRREGKY